MTWRIGTALTLLAVACHVAVRAQGQEPGPTFRSSVTAVPVTVIVTGADGRPVTDLTRDDFEIIEDGIPQPITTFSFVTVPAERRERTTTSDVLDNGRPPGRLYLIALDTMSAEAALRVRYFLRQFIERHFGPNDTAAVVLTTGGLSTSGQDFTSDPRLLLEAIDKFDGGIPTPGGREKNFHGSLRDLTEVLARIPGPRKAMILVTPGIPADPLDLVDERPGRFTRLFSNVDPDFRRALSAATRGNIAIYPVDPAGLTTDLAAPGSFDASALETRGPLASLAAVTGGFAVTSTNRYEASFARLVDEHSHYYLLAFNSSSAHRDGRYLRFDVRVKRPGLQVRAPGGYVAPVGTPDPPRRPTTVLTAAWDAVASPLTTTGVPMRVFAAPFKGSGKDATVAITLEVAASKLNLVEKDGAFRGEMDVVLAVTAADKKKYRPMRHRAALALRPETYARAGAVRVITQLALPKGQYQLRISAGDNARAGSVVYDVTVPDFADGLSISGLSVSSVQANTTATASPHARLDVTLPSPPTTAREFVQDDRLTLFAQVYENRRQPHTVQITGELRDDTGRVVSTTSIERTAPGKPAGASVYPFSPSLSLASVPAGRYTLRVEARSSLDRGSSVSREVPITVR